MRKYLVLLSPENQDKNKPTKILDQDLNKIKSFNSGLNFYFEKLEYTDLHKALKTIFKYDNQFMILGGLTPLGEELVESQRPGERRKKKGEPTIKDRDGDQIVLDLDDHVLDDYDPLEPEPGIRKWLKEKGINCDVTWQITSSQKLNTEEARIRLYFEASKQYSLEFRKAWAQSPEIMADGSVFVCSQPIYTAPPVIKNGSKIIDDPIPQRHGFIKGVRRKYALPKITENKQKEYIRSFNNHEYDFEDPDLPDEVLSGKVYRRYFMPLAFHYANKLKSDREAIFAIIERKAKKVKNRPFNAENVLAYIDDAISKIKDEDRVAKDELLNKDDIQNGYDEELDDLPEFPEDLPDRWPDPWPMLWYNFKKVPRELNQALLLPTMLATNAYFLRANFVTGYGRRPNMFFLNLTPSTGNKDVNSKNVIRDLSNIFKKKGNLSSPFMGILNTESNITADSTFLQSFNDKNEFFWVNTEATRIFQQIKMSGSVSAVAALSDKLIEVVDGHEITGKMRAAGKVGTITDPNCQVLFYAQPETIERYIDDTMVDSGLFGRSLITVIPNIEFDTDSYEMFKMSGGVNADIDDEFISFYSSQQFNLQGLSANKTTLAPGIKARNYLNEWARDYVVPKMNEDESFYKVLSRIGNSAEQLYVIVLGICRLWDAYIGDDPREKIDITCLIPLLEYWVDTKIYAISNFVNTEFDPLAQAILEIVKGCVVGKYKMPGSFDNETIKRYNMVSKAQVMRVLKSNKKLIQKLASEGDNRNGIERAERIMNTFVKSHVLKEELVRIGTSQKVCIGLLR